MPPTWYHLLGEPETTIEDMSSSSCFFASSSFFSLAALRRLGSFHSPWHLAAKSQVDAPREKWMGICWAWPPGHRIPVVNEGLGWDPLITKNGSCHPGGHDCIL